MIINTIIQGDCIEQMKGLDENSVDAIITDPPYGIGFMGKEWDNFKPNFIQEAMKKDTRPKTQIASTRTSNTAGTYDLPLNGNQKFQVWFKEVAKECLRVLKPGGYLLSFGGTRTYHRMTCGIEDAGFEIRDTIMWLYGSGFPKSLNIGKQIDKIQGNERESIGRYKRPNGTDVSLKGTENPCFASRGGMNESVLDLTKGNSEYEGWGTALKPAVEPIVVARKPLSEKNVALNVLKWGTGGINIDECRIDSVVLESEKRTSNSGTSDNINFGTTKDRSPKFNGQRHNPQGRFPSNVILDEEAGKMLDEQSGESISSGGKKPINVQSKFGQVSNKDQYPFDYGDKGGASRFFYCPKASKSERNFGCEVQEDKNKRPQGEAFGDGSAIDEHGKRKGNNHPTVKPIKLMEYLIKLVSRKGATILDPFIGSGTTAIACIKLNRKFIGIEKEEEYIKIAHVRIKPYLEQTKLK